MNEIKFIFPALEDLVLLNAGCCCQVHIPEGYAYGTKLIIIESPGD